MKGEWVEAERVEEVRAAARGWKTAGAIGEDKFEEISRLYPEPRTNPAYLWRALVFVLVSLVLLLLAGAFLAAAAPNLKSVWMFCAVFGMAFVATAELQARSRALALRGGVEAAATWGIVFLVAALFFFLEEVAHAGEPEGPNLVLAGATALLLLAAWRWGNAVFAGLGAATGFVLLARAPAGRLLWIAAGVALAALLERGFDAGRLSPSARRSAAAGALVALAAVYAAVNLWSLDRHAIEEIRGRTWELGAPSDLARAAAILGTILVPVLVFARGLRSRRRVFLDAGLVFAALSLVTLRAYVHVAEEWVVLVAAGSGLVLAALGASRTLGRAPGKERGGFTVEPLFHDAESFRAVELAPVLAAHAPAARPAPESGFSGGGGSFGGGGAGASY